MYAKCNTPNIKEARQEIINYVNNTSFKNKDCKYITDIQSDDSLVENFYRINISNDSTRVEYVLYQKLDISKLINSLYLKESISDNLQTYHDIRINHSSNNGSYYITFTYVFYNGLSAIDHSFLNKSWEIFSKLYNTAKHFIVELDQHINKNGNFINLIYSFIYKSNLFIYESGINRDLTPPEKEQNITFSNYFDERRDDEFKDEYGYEEGYIPIIRYELNTIEENNPILFKWELGNGFEVFEVLVTSSRMGLTMKDFKQIFEKNTKKIDDVYLTMVGRGEEATFTMKNKVYFENKQIFLTNPQNLANKVIKFFELINKIKSCLPSDQIIKSVNHTQIQSKPVKKALQNKNNESKEIFSPNEHSLSSTNILDNKISVPEKQINKQHNQKIKNESKQLQVREAQINHDQLKLHDNVIAYFDQIQDVLAKTKFFADKISKLIIKNDDSAIIAAEIGLEGLISKIIIKYDIVKKEFYYGLLSNFDVNQLNLCKNFCRMFGENNKFNTSIQQDKLVFEFYCLENLDLINITQINEAEFTDKIFSIYTQMNNAAVRLKSLRS